MVSSSVPFAASVSATALRLAATNSNTQPNISGSLRSLSASFAKRSSPRSPHQKSNLKRHRENVCEARVITYNCPPRDPEETVVTPEGGKMTDGLGTASDARGPAGRDSPVHGLALGHPPEGNRLAGPVCNQESQGSWAMRPQGGLFPPCTYPLPPELHSYCNVDPTWPHPLGIFRQCQPPYFNSTQFAHPPGGCLISGSKLGAFFAPFRIPPEPVAPPS